jgi:putative transposase
MDFVDDQLATGSKLRILTVIDTFSRFSLAIVPRDRVQGGEFISRDLDL